MGATDYTSKLDAVNTMLSQMGEEPYSSLTGQTTAEVRIAETILDETLKDVLTEGWLFNTEEDVTWSPNSGEIVVPSNAINVWFLYEPKKKYTVRQGKVYNRDEQTFTISDDLRVNYTILLEFEDIPEVARQYVAIKAGREYQRRYLGSEQVEVFTQQKEYEAKARLEDQEGTQRDASILDHPDIHTGVLGNRADIGGYGVV